MSRMTRSLAILLVVLYCSVGLLATGCLAEGHHSQVPGHHHHTQTPNHSSLCAWACQANADHGHNCLVDQAFLLAIQPGPCTAIPRMVTVLANGLPSLRGPPFVISG